MENIQQSATRLNAAGLKVTPQRIAVLQALTASGTHPTAEEIYRIVSRSIPGLSPTTVYNVLEALVRHKLIMRVKTGSGVMRYDADINSHHHLYDDHSDRMEDYHDPELDKILEDYFSRKSINGFRMKDLRLQIMGEFEKK